MTSSNDAEECRNPKQRPEGAGWDKVERCIAGLREIVCFPVAATGRAIPLTWQMEEPASGSSPGASRTHARTRNLPS